MRSILLSIKPKYVADILNGRKTIEIRKQCPKCDLPIDVYIYCTKDNKQHLYPVLLLDNSNQVSKKEYREAKIDNRSNYLNGKVVAKCDCKNVEEIKLHCLTKYNSYGLPSVVCEYTTKTLTHAKLKEQSCLSSADLEDYFANALVEKHSIIGTAIHIENLVIFDKPKELSEFYLLKECKKCKTQCSCFNKGIPCMETLTKAPQSYCFVESEE